MPLESPILPVREYFDRILAEKELALNQRFRDLERSVDERVAAAQTAVTKAEEATEKRFESVNEFRAALNDQAQKLATKAEMDKQFQLMTARMDEQAAQIKDLQKHDAIILSKGEGFKSGWAAIAAVIALIVAAFAILARFKGFGP